MKIGLGGYLLKFNCIFAVDKIVHLYKKIE